jgi:hypothetical protein
MTPSGIEPAYVIRTLHGLLKIMTLVSICRTSTTITGRYECPRNLRLVTDTQHFVTDPNLSQNVRIYTKGHFHLSVDGEVSR